MDTIRYIITAAPAAYDYGYTEQVAEGEYRGKPVRLVTAPESHADYQHDRYLSGLYATRFVDARDVARPLHELLV